MVLFARAFNCGRTIKNKNKLTIDISNFEIEAKKTSKKKFVGISKLQLKN